MVDKGKSIIDGTVNAVFMEDTEPEDVFIPDDDTGFWEDYYEGFVDSNDYEHQQESVYEHEE